MEIENINAHLSCISVSNMLSTWAYVSDELCFLVDPGPAVSINSLKKSLDHLNIRKNGLDYILLTHIHIDHAGGVGKLLNFYPNSKVICHQRGIRHLINPKKLWEGSRIVLGKAATEFYGKIEPVPEESIEYQENIINKKINIIETLGHSPHHQSYLFKDILFIGEACGHHYPTGEIIFIRPATPPIFDFDRYVVSLQKLINLKLNKFKICFPHWGMRDNADLIVKIAFDQINTWLRVVESLYDRRNESDFMELLYLELLKNDKVFSNLKHLDQEIQAREPFTMRQSVAGIMGYIEKKKKDF